MGQQEHSLHRVPFPPSDACAAGSCNRAMHSSLLRETRLKIRMKLLAAVAPGACCSTSDDDGASIYPLRENFMNRRRAMTVVAVCTAFVCLTEQAGAQAGRGPGAPGTPAALNDLKVRIVLETAPGVYVPLSVPVGTVVSVNAVTPATPPSIIKCPAIAGVAVASAPDCFENGLASNTSIKLEVAPMSANGALVPNARFVKWTDIPGSAGFAISNACTWSAYMPNIKCTMAGNRFIQAVYRCNDTFTYDPVFQQCRKSGSAVTACLKFMPHVSACRLALMVRRANPGSNTYTVSLSPGALTPSTNPLPSTSAICRNNGNALLHTACGYSFTANPTSVTLTAVSSAGPLPVGFFWSGACTGSNASCSITISQYQGTGNAVVANFPQ